MSYLRNKLSKLVERRKSQKGMEAGLPTIKVDVYELDRILKEHKEQELEVENFRTASKEARKTIDRLNEHIAELDPQFTESP